MKDDEMLRRAVHEAADACLSGVDAMPSLHGDIMRHIKGEKVVKKKISFALVCAIIMVLALGGAAVASGVLRMSHFSEILEEEQPWDAERLSRVDQLTADLGQTIHLTTPKTEKKGDTLYDQLIEAMGGREFDLTIDEVYCNGNKLYYTFTFSHDENLVFTGEGKPTGFDDDTWDLEWPDTKWEDIVSLGNPEYWDEEDAWFTEHPNDSWFASLNCYVGDGADLADGTELRIWDSWSERDEAGNHVEFYEVELPEGYEAGDSVDIVMTVIYNASLNYVNEEGVHWASIAPEENRGFLRVPVTIPVTGSVTPMSGSAELGEYSAKAEVLVSDFDIAGTVTVQAAEGWDTTAEPMTGDLVRNYILISDGEEKENIIPSVSLMREDGTYEVHMRFNLPASMESLSLRPEHRLSGIVEDGSEDIVIK